MDEIYLATSPSWEKGKCNIKIGRSINSSERKKKYDTHNPEAAFIQVFKTPSRAFSEFIEDALLFKIHRMRVSLTEWYKVDEEFYTQFQKLTNLQEVLTFCDFIYFLTTQEEISNSRFEGKEISKRTYTDHTAKYNRIRKELKEWWD